ncbi:MAG: sulfurtransferase/chromate resistance protein [Proteobacteria bacterium]|nr:sulfurtransferase/chromate resistance protein [Pseudomonadota bacterium]
MTSPTEISVQQLSRLVGLPDGPGIVDVRIDEDFDLDPRLIPGSCRRSHRDVAEWASGFAGRKLVIVCQRGLKLSQGAAAMLRHEGVAAESLEGGYEAWTDAGQPVIHLDSLPNRDARGRTVWVTRGRPKIDRIACPWLIKRFIDPDAVFLYVAPSEVTAVGERFGAAPFDIDGAFWSHRGDCCTFDTMLDEFGLNTGPLAHLATIIRGADTDRHDLAPESAGLLAVSLGLSRAWPDDLEQLAASLPLYDALYRWCRDATGETHDWPQPKAMAGVK